MEQNYVTDLRCKNIQMKIKKTLKNVTKIKKRLST